MYSLEQSFISSTDACWVPIVGSRCFCSRFVGTRRGTCYRRQEQGAVREKRWQPLNGSSIQRIATISGTSGPIHANMDGERDSVTGRGDTGERDGVAQQKQEQQAQVGGGQTVTVGNLFEHLPAAHNSEGAGGGDGAPGDGDGDGEAHEMTEILARAEGMIVERIVSTNGHATPGGEWYDQDETEFCTVLRGAARLLFADDSGAGGGGGGGGGVGRIVEMPVGAWVVIPAHVRHRVEWTSPDVPTVWMAVKWKA